MSTQAEADDEMFAHISSTADPDTLEWASILNDLKKVHIRTAADDEIDQELKLMIAHIRSRNSPDGYAITISGKSGAGKTTTLYQRLDLNPSLQPFRNKYNNPQQLCLRLKTPAGCTMKTLGRAILRAMGYHLRGRKLDEEEIWDKVIENFKLRQIRILVLDEFQHVLNAPTNKGYLHCSEAIKNLMQTESWPVWLIICGVPEIEGFVKLDPNQQMERRAPIVRVGRLEDDGVTNDMVAQRDGKQKDHELIEEALYLLAETCRLEVGFQPDSEFKRRLMHGGLWRFGMTIQIIKYAIERCLRDSMANKMLTQKHFEEGYARLSDCTPETNVFIADNWLSIDREVDEDGMLVNPASIKRTRRRRSSR
ncbi:ATP-binding protein [Rhizobium ruizarguesonis]